jgi:hypothetical protein
MAVPDALCTKGRVIRPSIWLTDAIARIGSHPINRLAELLPWNRQHRRRKASPPEPHSVKRKER